LETRKERGFLKNPSYEKKGKKEKAIPSAPAKGRKGRKKRKILFVRASGGDKLLLYGKKGKKNPARLEDHSRTVLEKREKRAEAARGGFNSHNEKKGGPLAPKGYSP